MMESAFPSSESILYDDNICGKKKWKFQLISKKMLFVGYFSEFDKIQNVVYGYEGDEPYIHHYRTKNN